MIGPPRLSNSFFRSVALRGQFIKTILKPDYFLNKNCNKSFLFYYISLNLEIYNLKVLFRWENLFTYFLLRDPNFNV